MTAGFVIPEINLPTVLAPIGEEGLWPDSGLMNRWRHKFTGFLLPKCCEPGAEAEPKRNLICVPENDFTPKFLPVAL